MKEMVNHPSHYTKNGHKECIVEIEERFGTLATIHWCLLNAYKYLYRAGLKDGNTAQQDINKARWYREYAMKLELDVDHHHTQKDSMWQTIDNMLEGYGNDSSTDCSMD